MFVDSDVELGDGCIAKLRCDIEKHGWAGILATVLSSENKSYWQKAGQENYSLFAHRLGPTNYIGTGATLFRKHVLLEHQFDVDFEESLEDVDLCRRLVEANCPLGVSSATAYHSLPRDFLAFFKHQLRDGRGNARLALKYRSTWILVSPLFNVLHVVIYGTLTGRIRLIPFWLVANSAKFLGTVLGALEIRNERPKAKTQAMLTSEEQGLSGQPVVRPDTMCS
jgi:GT2 family glycosyltransferase